MQERTPFLRKPRAGASESVLKARPWLLGFSRREFVLAYAYFKYGPESPSVEIDFSKSKIMSPPIACLRIMYLIADTAISSFAFWPLASITLFTSPINHSAVITWPVRELILPVGSRSMPWGIFLV